MSNQAVAPVYVESEFAPLKTVVLAQSQMHLPARDAVPETELNKFLSIFQPEERKRIEDSLGEDYAAIWPERQRQWETERLNFKAVLDKYGIEVLRPELLTRPQRQAGGKFGYSNSYVRDPWFTVGTFVIEASLRAPHRRREVLASRKIMYDRVFPADCHYVALPQADAIPLDQEKGNFGPYIEGGDVLVLNKHVFVGNSGLASSATGIQFLEKLLKPHGYQVHAIRLKPNFLHLDCVLSLVRDGLMLVCEGGILEELPEPLKNWDRIPVSEKDASLLGANGIAISPSVYVTDPVFAEVVDRLQGCGVTVETVDFKVTRSFGGSFRCSTQYLWRKS